MNASELLQGYGITLQQASDWIQANLENPGLIYQTALDLGIDSAMLAEIVQPWVPGADATLVETFFAQQGLDPVALYPDDGESFSAFLPAELQTLTQLVVFNDNTGVLATDSLRTAAMSQVNPNAYWNVFDPGQYDEAGDGVLSADDLGVPGLVDFTATPENLESLLYGTVIKIFKSIDVTEAQQLQDWMLSGADAEDSTHLIVQILSTPATTPLLSDEDLAQTVAATIVASVELVGVGDDSYGGVLGGLFA